MYVQDICLDTDMSTSSDVMFHYEQSRIAQESLICHVCCPYLGL